MVVGISFKTPFIGTPVTGGDSLSRKQHGRSDFGNTPKHRNSVPRGAKPLEITNGFLNPNPQAIRNPIPKQEIQALQAAFSSVLDIKQTDDPNQALRSLVLMGTRILQQVEHLKADNDLPNAKIIVYSKGQPLKEWLAKQAAVDLRTLTPDEAQSKDCLQRTTAVVGLLLFFTMLYQQPEILTNGLGYLTQEGVKDAQAQWNKQSENLKFDIKSLLAKVQRKALPADTLIFSKEDRALMTKVAAVQGFDTQTDAGLQAYTQWMAQVLQQTADAINTVGHPYQLSVMGYGWDEEKGIPRQTEYQDVFQRQE